MEKSIKESEILSLAAKAANGTFESLIYLKEVRMNKGGRQGANTLYGRVTKLTSATQIQFGVNYENKINNERERQGLERDFVSQSLKGKEWVSFPCILRSLKSGELMLRVTCTAATKFSEAYFVDNRPATADEIAMIEQYAIKSEKVVFDISLEKIVGWNVGGAVFFDTDLAATINTKKAA